jgi:hypothetical protein
MGSVSIGGYDTRWTWALDGGNRGFLRLLGRMDDVVVWDLCLYSKNTLSLTKHERLILFNLTHLSKHVFFNFVFYSLKSFK